MNKEIYQPRIMGIVNVTPDSFSDGGKFFETKKAVEQGLKLAREGADILDIGGESTRPGAEPVSVEKELERVIPVIESLREQTEVLISIDTRRAAVMTAALTAGANMINDVTALTFDPDSLEVVAQSNEPVCLMHMQGSPADMQSDPTYEDVVAEVYEYLAERIKACEAAEINKEKIYIDVGIGFGKTLEHNLTLLKNLDTFKSLGVKTLLGTSRKGFIGKITGEMDTTKRLPGSLASLVPGLEARIDVFRVHDVAETKQFIDIYLRTVSY